MSKICDNCIHNIKLKNRGRFACDVESRDTSVDSCRDKQTKKYIRPQYYGIKHYLSVGNILD